MRNNNELKLKDAVDVFLKAYRLKTKFDETAIKSSWEKLMGKTIAKYTNKIYVKDKRLYIMLDSSVLKEELTYHKSIIIAKVNNEIGEKFIEDVIIK